MLGPAFHYDFNMFLGDFAEIWSNTWNQDLPDRDDIGPTLRRGHIGLQGPASGRRVLRSRTRIQIINQLTASKAI